MNQQDGIHIDKNQAFHLLRIIVGAHATTITPFLRSRFGLESLGFRGLYAAVMLLFAAANIPGMGYYLAAWFIVLVIRRAQTIFFSGSRVHTRYDGWPFLTIWVFRKEHLAKLIGDPLLCVIAAMVMGAVAEANDLEWLYPISTWVFLGFISLAFDRGVHEALLLRRTQAMRDARLEQEELMDRFHNERW